MIKIKQQFGKLTVLSGAGGNYIDKWLCQCSCGNFTVVLGMALRTGLAKSCRGLEILSEGSARSCLHNWMRKNKPRPKLCERCKKNPATDFSSKGISSQCGRSFDDYEWVCRSCRFLKAMTKSKDIYEIRKSYACGTFTQEELAMSFSISMKTIGQIIQCKGAYSEMK